MQTPHTPSENHTVDRKILLIGWDAADWKVINPLVDAGKMPNLAKFIDQGVMGNIATLQPVLSPMLWSSIATGKRPYKHGVHGFTEPDPVTGGVRPVTNLSRKTKAVWNILNQEDKNTITVGWWPSNPAEPLSKGVMVSNDYHRSVGDVYDPEKWPLKPGSVHPTRLNEPLKNLRFHPAELNEEDLRPFLPGIADFDKENLEKLEKDPRVQSLMKIIADATSVHAAATALIQIEPWDLMCVYYDAIDHFGHAFMKYHPPQRKQIDDWDFKVFNYCNEAGYIFHDMMLGTLLSLVDDDTTVMLISDHGFHPDDFRLDQIPNEPAGPAAEHRQFGIFCAKGPGIKKDERVYGAGLLDICPTLLHLFGLPVGEDMDGKVLLDIYQNPPTEIDRIPSWDDVGGDHGMHSPDTQISAEDSKAALDQLVALGYIDEPDTNQSKALDQTVRELDYNLAQAYVDGGILTEAVTIFERLYQKYPMEHRFGYKLANCYRAQNRPADVRTQVTTVIERRLQDAKEAQEELKTLKLDTEERVRADQEEFKKLTEAEQQKRSHTRRCLITRANPNLFHLRYLEATADFAEKKYQDTLHKLKDIDSDFGSRQNALLLKGETHSRLQQWDLAHSCFEEILQKDQETPGPLLGLARIALAKRNYQEVIEYTQASIGLLFYQPRAHYIRGMALLRLERFLEAEDAFHICVRQAPLYAAAWRQLADIAQRQRHDPHATVFYKQQVKIARQRLAEDHAKKSADLSGSASGQRFHQNNAETEMPVLNLHAHALKEVPEEKIITIVSGLPRSGTSLMMQLLEAAGIQAFTDRKRDADDSNQKGYYEHEKVMSLLHSTPEEKQWITAARGKSLKVVAPLISSLPKMGIDSLGNTEKIHYRIIFMERNLEEVLASQTSMLNRLGKESSKGDPSKAYIQQLRAAKAYITGRGIPALPINFVDLVHTPDQHLVTLASFLNTENQIEAMKLVIDPSLHRAKR